MATEAMLDTLALAKHIACYSDVAPIVGFPARSSKFWALLGQSMRIDQSCGRPIRCSLVVNKQTGIPGNSYFDMAASLGYVFENTQEGRIAFWRSQLEKFGIRGVPFNTVK